eukprot:g7547.t1
MKPVSSFARIIAALVAATHASAVEYTVSTCADLADVDDSLATGLTIDSAAFACDEYTRFRVRNTMTLKATGPSVEFSNFSLKVLGELTVEPNVIFSGVEGEEKNGGVLNVAEGAKATFMGASEFSDNSISVEFSPLCGNDCSDAGRGSGYIVKKGAAIHNKGMLTFEGDAAFVRNVVVTGYNWVQGKAGAVSNTKSGSILFKGKLTVLENEAEGKFAGNAGGFLNKGDIVVDGESNFSLNLASAGGAIYQTSIGTMTFNAMATFSANRGDNMEGGAIMNAGGVIDFNAGSLFEKNVANGSGDGGRGGAIFNEDGGVITLMGSTAFKENSAFWGGAIFNSAHEPVPTTTFPDDTVFVDNSAEYCNDVNNGDVDHPSNGLTGVCPVF